MTKFDSSEMIFFGLADVWNVTGYIGLFSVVTGIILIVFSLIWGANWTVLVSTIWTLIPTLLVYGVVRRKRAFFKPYIYTNQCFALVGLFVSVGLMILSFTDCFNEFQGHCAYAKFGGPLFALSVCMLYFSYVVSLAICTLDKEKQVENSE